MIAPGPVRWPTSTPSRRSSTVFETPAEFTSNTGVVSEVIPSDWLGPVSLDASRTGAEGAEGTGGWVVAWATKILAIPVAGTAFEPNAIDPE